MLARAALLLSLNTAAGSEESQPGLLPVLDGLAVVMGAGARFPRAEFTRLVRGLTALDPALYHSQEAGWRGVVQYHRAGGGPGDPWGGTPSQFQERNLTLLPLHSGPPLVVFEPCNFASNLAYYELSTAVASYRAWRLPRSTVRALGQSAAALALGSAFWHGSHTRLGSRADTELIGVMAFILHQASVAHLPPSPVLTDLSPRSRPHTGLEVAQLLTDLYRTQPPTAWLATLSSLGLPSYQATFSALITSLLTILVPPQLGRPHNQPASPNEEDFLDPDLK